MDDWLNSSSEDQHLEFKEAKQQLDTRTLCKYCVALANEGGGHLVLGVSDKKPRKVVGTKAYENPTTMASKIYTHTKFRVDIKEFPHPDGRIVIFEAPSRPQGTAYQYNGVYWVRSGSQLMPASEDWLRKVFAEGAPDWLEQPAKKGVKAQDVIHLLDTRSFFDLLRLPYPHSQTRIIEKLISERLVTGQDDIFNISNLAAVTLAKNLRDFKSVAFKGVRVIVYQGDDKTQAVKEEDINGKMGYAAGFQNLIRCVMKHLPQNEVIEDALRTESKMLPESSIRELVANALIHQDFEESGTSLMIEIYHNRVEISNPGEPIVPIERFLDSGKSRNEPLAEIMRRFRICEKRSSGIDTVIREAEDYQLPAPDFQIGFKSTIVIIFGPRSFADMDRHDRIRACRQHCYLQYVLRKQMTNQSLRQRFGLPSSQNNANIVSQIIANTIDNGFIQRDPAAPDTKKYARYLPIWA